jgi:hypothetical protein
MNHESKAQNFLFLVFQSVSRANTGNSVNMKAPSLFNCCVNSRGDKRHCLIRLTLCEHTAVINGNYFAVIIIPYTPLLTIYINLK